MTELGRCVDPFELNLLQSAAAGVYEHGLAESDNPLLDTGNGTLDEKEVVLDLTVADEATKTRLHVSTVKISDWKVDLRSDLLLGDIVFGRGVTLVSALANAVDLVVDGSTVVVSVLTSTGNSPLDVGRMPGTDTGDLAETLVCLTGKLLGAPTGGDTVESLTLGDGDNVNHLVVLEDGGDLDGLLEKAVGERDLVGDVATVDLDLHQVGLLLLERSLGDLGVCEHTDDLGVLLDALELLGDGRTVVLGVLLGVLGEGLLLALVPALVEATLDLIAQVLGPDGGERTETAGSLDVANDTNSDHLGSC